VDAVLAHSFEEPLSHLRAEGPERGAQPVADRFGFNSRLELDKYPDPTPVRSADSGVHHGGDEDVGRRAGLDACKAFARDAYDLI
jgi:hypothetical protein